MTEIRPTEYRIQMADGSVIRTPENIFKAQTGDGFIVIYGTVSGRTGTFSINRAQIIYVEVIGAAG